MSKYKSLTEPITRREACLIVDRKRFDAAVRSGEIVALGKRSISGPIVESGDAPLTSPLLFDQATVREFSAGVARSLEEEARECKVQAREFQAMSPPLTRRQVASVLGKRTTGILIRSGELVPYGTLTDTQTAAHTYDPVDVARVLGDIATCRKADAALLKRASKTRIPS